MRAVNAVRGMAFVAALVAVPSIANADVWTRNWSVCNGTTVKSCHSVQLQTTGFGGYTAVKVTIRNLNGQAGLSGDNTTWSSLNQLRFYGSGMTVNGADAAAIMTASTFQGGATGSATGWNSILNGTSIGVLRLNGITAPDGTNRRIGGCTAGAGATAPTIFTCGGEVVFSFTTSTLFNAGQMTGLYTRIDANGSTINQQCQTDGSVYTGSVTTGCSTALTDVTVTPEPVTIALLGSGLFGIAGARMRRKKKNEA